MDELQAKIKCYAPDDSTASEQTFQDINNIDNMLTNISLESERCIRPRGKARCLYKQSNAIAALPSGYDLQSQAKIKQFYFCLYKQLH
jgi:hypothetical protein